MKPVIWIAAVAGIAIAHVSHAQNLPPCAVGTPVKNMTNYPAKIVAVDAAKGSYKVRTDSNGEERWMPAAWLTRSCVSAQPAARSADKFFVGQWSMFVSPVSGYRRDDPTGRMVTTSGAKAPPLTIKADGSYSWNVGDGKIVNGRWRVLKTEELKAYTKAPAILLMKGYQDMDWQVHKPSVSSSNVDQVTVEGYKIGLNYLATRMH